MGTWFHETVVDNNRLALFLCFLAFVVTFVVTRIVTRNIRAGRGPFKDNVSASGTHIHHAVPGIILLVTGAFMSVATAAEHPWAEISAVMIGVGTSLVLDEFALILHLSDVYWSEQGRVSIEVVSLAVACLGLALVGFSPNMFTGRADTRCSSPRRSPPSSAPSCSSSRWWPSCSSPAPTHSGRRGSTAPPAWRRLAARAARFDDRWGRHFDAVSDFIGGRPSDERTARRRPATGRVNRRILWRRVRCAT